MIGDDDIPSDEGRTVFLPPSGASAPPAPSPPPPPGPTAWGASAPPAPTPQLPPGPTAWGGSAPPAPTSAPFSGMPAQGGGRVEIGAVLNGIFKVERLIARGGMGEVFEGVNVNDEHDRVAIKVMLPALAADPNVQAMFRKEGRMTRLSHPAVVQYRMIAQESTYGVFYIVTEFIDGVQLSELVGRVKPTSADLRALTRRLAEGLKAAHDIGAVHRDISPDNILVPQSNLMRAKIIDFGIAKDLDPSKATIVGDGFAGKLGYVAPEQLGDFGREIGPWTDIYSLGLVILTFAAGRNLDMGATLVDAVDKRRAGPDISVAPEDLRPILARMLAANPVNRARSMDEVLEMLAGGAPATTALPPPTAAPVAAKPAKAPKPPAPPKPPASGGGLPVVPMAVGGVALLAVLGAGAFFLLGKKPAASTGAAAPAAAAAPTDAEAGRRAIEAALNTVPCSWLDVASATASGGGVGIKLTGVAASTQSAESAALQAARGAGVQAPDLDLQDVSTVDAPVCPTLDAFRPFRTDVSVSGAKLSTSQTKYTLEKQADGTLAQKALITMAIGDPSTDFALFAVEPSGVITTLIPNRAMFLAKLQDPSAKSVVTQLDNDGYRLSINTSHTGLSGVLLLTGRGPFDPKLIAAPPAEHGPGWPASVAAAASSGGWKSEMVWYKTVAPAG